MSLTIVGGAIFQWPLGRLSDHIDRRWTIIICCLGAGLAGGALVAFSGVSHATLLVLSFLYGGFIFPLYALVIAHANDAALPEDFIEVSSGLLLVYSVGAISGPVIASAVMEWVGYSALFGYTAIIHGLLALYTFYRMRRRVALPPDERENFVATQKTSPAAFQMDPRYPGDSNDISPVEPGTRST